MYILYHTYICTQFQCIDLSTHPGIAPPFSHNVAPLRQRSKALQVPKRYPEIVGEWNSMEKNFGVPTMGSIYTYIYIKTESNG